LPFKKNEALPRGYSTTLIFSIKENLSKNREKLAGDKKWARYTNK
jgi:hypothetical protein